MYSKKKSYVEHVLHVVDWDERIVDGDNLDVGIGTCCAEHKTTNTPKSVDTDFNGGHFWFVDGNVTNYEQWYTG